MRDRNKTITLCDQGFTLIEAVIAMAVLTVGVLALQMMQARSIDENSLADGITIKAMIAASVIERIMSLPYDDPLLGDTDGDGSNQDSDFDGVDDDTDGDVNTTHRDEEFGLHHRQCCPGNVDPRGNVVAACAADPDAEVADQCDFFDGYDVYWNVAVEHPLYNTRTVNVIVVDQADKSAQTARPVHRAEYRYIKFDTG